MALTLPYGDEYYYTDEYKTVVRSCKELILQQASWVPITDPSISYSYRNNFHRFLRNIELTNNVGISEDMIWTISYINGMENPNKDFSSITGLWFVSKDTIDSFIQINRVQRQ